MLLLNILVLQSLFRKKMEELQGRYTNMDKANAEIIEQ
jgi:hypothetical protein